KTKRKRKKTAVISPRRLSSLFSGPRYSCGYLR
ncbi:hypothetical protein JMJ77_0005229, partial [Colletotrichum scovillei]